MTALDVYEHVMFRAECMEHRPPWVSEFRHSRAHAERDATAHYDEAHMMSRVSMNDHDD